MRKGLKSYLMISFISIFFVISVTSWQGRLDYKSTFAGGTGTVADPYQITHIEHLYEIRYYLNSNFSLMNNLDFQSDASYTDASHKTSNLTGTGWLPIGDEINKFNGTFNGNNYTISNLFINRTTNYIGLFSCSKGTVKYVGLKNVSVTGQGNVSGLIGMLGWAVGGLESTYFVNGTYVTGNVTGIEYVGGLVGRSAFGHIDNSYSSTNIRAIRYSGGFIGYAGGSYINNSYSLGNVSRISDWNITLAGFVGYNSQSSINKCYSTGYMNYSTNRGFAGILNTGGGYEDFDNFYDNQTSGQTSTLGNATGKYTIEMKRIYIYRDSGWDISYSDTYLNNGYPFLGFQIGEPLTWYISNTRTPELISIENGLNGTNIWESNPTIVWAVTSNTGLYWLQIANDSLFTDLVVNLTDISFANYPSNYSDNSINVTFSLPTENTLTVYKKYYIRIKSHLK